MDLSYLSAFYVGMNPDAKLCDLKTCSIRSEVSYSTLPIKSMFFTAPTKSFMKIPLAVP